MLATEAEERALQNIDHGEDVEWESPGAAGEPEPSWDVGLTFAERQAAIDIAAAGAESYADLASSYDLGKEDE